jgi:hypothetical protein
VDVDHLNIQSHLSLALAVRGLQTVKLDLNDFLNQGVKKRPCLKLAYYLPMGGIRHPVVCFPFAHFDFIRMAASSKRFQLHLSLPIAISLSFRFTVNSGDENLFKFAERAVNDVEANSDLS